MQILERSGFGSIIPETASFLTSITILTEYPSSHLEKVYEVTVTGLVNGETLHKLEKGIYLEGVKTLPCKIKVVGKDNEHKTTMLMIKLVEGKNRQVKKMFETMGHNVKRLHRVQVGGINLKGLNQDVIVS